MEIRNTGGSSAPSNNNEDAVRPAGVAENSVDQRIQSVTTFESGSIPEGSSSFDMDDIDVRDIFIMGHEMSGNLKIPPFPDFDAIERYSQERTIEVAENSVESDFMRWYKSVTTTVNVDNLPVADQGIEQVD